jgi:hypothetical protein
MAVPHKLKPLAAAIGLLLALPVQAASVNWTGTTGYWDVSGNWNLGLPTAIDDVIINVQGIQTVTVSSGSYTVNSINVTGDETLAVTGGALTINSTSNLGSFNQSGGTLSGPGNVNISGSASWTSGTQSGGGITTSNGDLTISSTNQKSLNGRSLVNNGTTILNTDIYYGFYSTNDGFLALSNGAGIVNNGTWLDQTSSYQRIENTGGGATTSFNNNGVYTKNNISNSYIDVAFNNNGTGILNVNAGTLNLVNGGLTNQGTITVASGATLAVQTPTFNNQGTLQGNGTYHTLNAATALVNSGTLAPGVGDIGALTVSGDYTQTTTGIFDIQLGSLTSFDKLNVFGNMNLSGALRIHSFGGYTPDLGNTFTIATFDDGIADLSDLTGIFKNIVWSGFNPGVSFTASYFAHSIVLNATTAPVPIPAALWMFGTGLIGLTGLAHKRKEA